MGQAYWYTEGCMDHSDWCCKAVMPAGHACSLALIIRRNGETGRGVASQNSVLLSSSTCFCIINVTNKMFDRKLHIKVTLTHRSPSRLEPLGESRDDMMVCSVLGSFSLKIYML